MHHGFMLNMALSVDVSMMAMYLSLGSSRGLAFSWSLSSVAAGRSVRAGEVERVAERVSIATVDVSSRELC
jgi:hypothetical protein